MNPKTSGEVAQGPQRRACRGGRVPRAATTTACGPGRGRRRSAIRYGVAEQPRPHHRRQLVPDGLGDLAVVAHLERALVLAERTRPRREATVVDEHLGHQVVAGLAGDAGAPRAGAPGRGRSLLVVGVGVALGLPVGWPAGWRSRGARRTARSAPARRAARPTRPGGRRATLPCRSQPQRPSNAHVSTSRQAAAMDALRHRGHRPGGPHGRPWAEPFHGQLVEQHHRRDVADARSARAGPTPPMAR